MSIYSGFATRSQEETYDQLTYQLINLLSIKILKSYRQEQANEPKFAKIIKEIFIKLSMMEKQKYLQPNLSGALYEIVEHYLKQEEPLKVELEQRKNSLWVKVENKSEETFTEDTHKNESGQLSSRKTSVNFALKNKVAIMNPEKTLYENKKPKKSVFEAPLINNKINKIKEVEKKEIENRKKHQSMRNFEENRFNMNIETEKHIDQKSICPHCCGERLPVKNKSSFSKNKNENFDKISKREINSSRILIPDLVKEYIEATNHAYMKNYRKRKIKFCSGSDYN